MKFNLVAHCTISITTSVEADSLEEAIEIAKKRTDIMNGEFEHPNGNEHWVSHEYDGMPYNIREEEK